MKKKKLVGELSVKDAKRFEELILMLQEINGGETGKGERITHVKPLPEKESEELWYYMLHVIELILVSPRYKKITDMYCTYNQSLSREEILEELKLDLAPYVYNYMWRKYRASDKPPSDFEKMYSEYFGTPIKNQPRCCGLVFSTAEMAVKSHFENHTSLYYVHESKMPLGNFDSDSNKNLDEFYRGDIEHENENVEDVAPVITLNPDGKPSTHIPLDELEVRGYSLF